jgi:hypothetical protein
MIGGSHLLPAAAAVGSLAGQALDLLTSRSSFAALLAHPGADAEDTADPGMGMATGEAASDECTLDGTSEGDIRRLETLRQNLKRLEQQVSDRLRARLASNPRIDMSEPIVLGVHSSGRILEMTGHRDRAVIEQLLENDPALSSQIQQLLEQSAALKPSNEPNSSTLAPRLFIDENRSVFQVV